MATGGDDGMTDEKRVSDKQIPPDQIEKRGIGHDVILPVLQEAKPIVEGTLAGLAVHKLTQGKNPPPPPKNEKD
jgi:hypothetical protein